jgi:hypothetical protein
VISERPTVVATTPSSSPPSSPERYYPEDADAFGNMIDSAGRLLPKPRWALSAVEHLFDEVRQAESLTTPTYDIVGHSAGGQFVHRLRLMRLSLAWARKHRCIAVLRLGYV